MSTRIEQTTSNTAYIASGLTVAAGGLSFNEWMMLGGFLIALATFLVNWYYRHKHYKLAERRAQDEED